MDNFIMMLGTLLLIDVLLGLILMFFDKQIGKRKDNKDKKTNNKEEKKKVPWLIISSFGISIVLLGIIIYLSIKQETFDIYACVSASSSFVLMLLTIVYVYASTKQMGIMKEQLSEMKDEHKMEEKPVALLSSATLEIETPRFFYTPPTDEFSFQSRTFFSAKVNNVSQYPIIGLMVDCDIITKRYDENGENPSMDILESTKEYVGFLGIDKTEEIHLLFANDLQSELLDAMRDKSQVCVGCRTVYKNTLGKSYQSIQIFDIEYYRNLTKPEIDIEAIIRNWHSTLLSNPNNRYREELKKLKQLRRDDSLSEEYHALFIEVNDKFQEALQYKENLEISVREAGYIMEYGPISDEKYKEIADFKNK